MKRALSLRVIKYEVIFRQVLSGKFPAFFVSVIGYLEEAKFFFIIQVIEFYDNDFK